MPFVSSRWLAVVGPASTRLRYVTRLNMAVVINNYNCTIQAEHGVLGTLMYFEVLLGTFGNFEVLWDTLGYFEIL